MVPIGNLDVVDGVGMTTATSFASEVLVMLPRLALRIGLSLFFVFERPGVANLVRYAWATLNGKQSI